ncbi:MAG: acetoin utilization protein AcuC, partial [Hasllibacter sp.]
MLAAPIFRHSSYGGRHPLRIPRVSTVVDLARALGWLPRDAYRTAPRAKAAALTGFHDPAYLAALQAAEAAQEVDAATRARHGLGTPSNPVFPEMWRRPATGAGGSLLAADLLADAPGRVHNPAGGTHHGLPDRASGFCYLNDPALALRRLKARGLRRLAYVDIDAHHPDGVAHALRDDPEVLMISTHEEGRWPRTGALDEVGPGTWFNLPLPRGAGDADLLAALHGLILPRVAAHRPEAIVLQCGADSVAED